MGGRSPVDGEVGSGRLKGSTNKKPSWSVTWYDKKKDRIVQGEFSSAEQMKLHPDLYWLGNKSTLHYYYKRYPKPNLKIVNLRAKE